MEHVTRLKLMTRRPQDLRPHQFGPGMDQGHDVLQLIAEAIGAAGLVERRAPPHTTGEGLVEQPTIEHQVHGGSGVSTVTVPRISFHRAWVASQAASTAWGS
jgi:hypothetical protein